MRTGRWAFIVGLTLVLLAPWAWDSGVLQAQAAPPLHRTADVREANASEANASEANASGASINEGRAQLQAGETAYAQGRYGDALDGFEASFRARPEAQTLRRIGDAADKLGSHARATEALKSYLLQVPDARDRVFIESRIAANQAALDAVRQQTLIAASSAKVTPESASGEGKALLPRRESAAPAAALAPMKSERSDSPAGPFWLWAAGGAVVVAGIVIAAVAIGSSASSRTAEPVRGNVGSAIQTLNSR